MVGYMIVESTSNPGDYTIVGAKVRSGFHDMASKRVIDDAIIIWLWPAGVITQVSDLEDDTQRNASDEVSA